MLPTYFIKDVLAKRSWSYDLDVLHVARCLWYILATTAWRPTRTFNEWALPCDRYDLGIFWKSVLSNLWNAKVSKMPDVMKIKSAIDNKLANSQEEANECFYQLKQFMQY